MDIKVNDKRLQVHSPERQPLVRMQTIIRNNQLTYHKAKKLASDYQQGLIPAAGYIGHKYLPREIGYRIISAYGGGDGFINTHYPTAAEAWQDPRIQSRIAIAGVQYADYDSYLNTVDSGRPWSLLGLTILHCRITVHGNILIVKNTPEQL
jgi:hypothetical protein